MFVLFLLLQARRTMMLDNTKAQESVDSYMSSVAELTVNSKPHINALTFLAEDYLNYAEAIVKAVDDHLLKVLLPT